MKTHTFTMIFAITALLSILIPKVTSSFDADKIISLPGQPLVKFQQFGGYITVDEIQERNLFYYFVEAENNPSSKPLVLWLSGGPGCSSIGAGGFSENGPFRPHGDALIKNGYSWNKEANMLYVESPAGVGFSYSKNKSFYIGVNDEMTAKDNLAFLQNWLAKYIEYKNRDFFITGESYAGHYVPQLASLILKSSLKLNLKGIAIGNPLLDFGKDLNPRAEYLWSHGLISDTPYELLQTTCNYSQIYRQSLSGSFTRPCDSVRRRMTSEMSELVDSYDVAHDNRCSHQQPPQIFKQRQMNEEKLGVCLVDETTKYFNRKDVQKALNAHLIGVTSWNFCTSGANPTIKYDMDDHTICILPLLGTLTNAGIRVLVYSGDQDSMISLIGTRTLINGLAKELNLKTTMPYSVWLVGKKVGGWIQEYGDNILSYAIIRGAGHEAPTTQPLRSLVLLRSFLIGKFPDGKVAPS